MKIYRSTLVFFSVSTNSNSSGLRQCSTIQLILDFLGILLELLDSISLLLVQLSSQVVKLAVHLTEVPIGLGTEGGELAIEVFLRRFEFVFELVLEGIESIVDTLALRSNEIPAVLYLPNSYTWRTFRRPGSERRAAS